MAPHDLDDVDKQLLNLVQEDARLAATELAERVGVADNTVHNRLQGLEEAGVVTGYRATLDPSRAGLSRYFIFVCTTDITERDAIAGELLTVPEVVEVTQLTTGQRNLHVKVVGATDDDITRVAAQLEDLPLEIDDANLIHAEYDDPLDFFAVEAPADE